MSPPSPNRCVSTVGRRVPNAVRAVGGALRVSERDGVELMIQEAAGPGRRFRTAPLLAPVWSRRQLPAPRRRRRCHTRPRVAAGFNIVVPIEERWYRVDVTERGGRWPVEGPTEAGNRQFVVVDPDGYLWRPFRDLGVRPATG